MFIIQIEPLVHALARQTLSQRAECLYLLILLALSAIGSWYLTVRPLTLEPNIWDHIRDGGWLLLCVLMPMIAYRVNGGESGRELLLRYAALSVVCAVRSLPLFFALIIAVVLIEPLFLIDADVWANDDTMTTTATPQETIALLLWCLWVCWRVLHHLARVRTLQQQPLPRPEPGVAA